MSSLTKCKSTALTVIVRGRLILFCRKRRPFSISVYGLLTLLNTWVRTMRPYRATAPLSTSSSDPPLTDAIVKLSSPRGISTVNRSSTASSSVRSRIFFPSSTGCVALLPKSSRRSMYIVPLTLRVLR